MTAYVILALNIHDGQVVGVCSTEASARETVAYLEAAHHRMWDRFGGLDAHMLDCRGHYAFEAYPVDGPIVTGEGE